MKIYTCKECDFITRADKPGAIGTAHGHAERHSRAFGILPAWLWPTANPDRLDNYIETVELSDVDAVTDILEGFCSINDIDRTEEERLKGLIREEAGRNG